MEQGVEKKKLRVLGLVLARGGSKGIKKKNIRIVCGQPLLSWVLRPMKNCKSIDEVWVSTDDPEIADVAEAEEANVFNRSSTTSEDYSTSVSAVQEFLEFKPGFDVVCLVQCTTPCLHPNYLEEAISLVVNKKFDSVFSVTRDFKWRWTDQNEDGTLRPLNFDPAHRICRQEWQGEIVESGHFYVTLADLIREGLLQGGRCGSVDIPQHLCHEVDVEEDLVIVEQKLLKYGYRGDFVLAAPTEFQ